MTVFSRPLPARPNAPSRLGHDREGVAALEFALVGPLVFLFLIGIIEFSLLISGYIVLNLAATEAARAGLTGFSSADQTREEMITEAVERYAQGFIDGSRIRLTTQVYESFAETVPGEPFTDANGNGTRDDSEWFNDINENGVWDDRAEGEDGIGGPNDIVLYNIDYEWRFLTPVLPYLIAGERAFDISASLAIRNEPFPDDL